MTPAARVAAAIDILDSILDGTPAEKALTGWARRSRFAGSKDRAAIRDWVFTALRRRNTAAALGGALTGRGLMLGVLRQEQQDIAAFFTGEGYGPSALTEAEKTRPEIQDAPLDLPDWAIAPLRCDLGNAFDATAEGLRHRAPVSVRVNTAKTTVDTARAALAEDGIICRSTSVAATALIVEEGERRIQNSAAFSEGWIEMQDAGSQAIALELPVATGARVLDYCAGGGGKSLAVAARGVTGMKAYDANQARLKDLPSRAARAGADITCIGEPPAKDRFDLVIADVPCSGSGAWRRQPETRWRMQHSDLADLRDLQSEIIYKTQQLVDCGGSYAYITCSLFEAENERQMDVHFADTKVWEVTKKKRWDVGPENDGFFLAVFKRLI